MVMFINRLEKIDEDENSRLTMPKVVSLSTCLDTADKGQCLCFGLFLFFFFFFFFEKIISHGIMHCSGDTQVLYLKKKKNIKIRFYSTIHTFKNYFVTVF